MLYLFFIQLVIYAHSYSRCMATPQTELNPDSIVGSEGFEPPTLTLRQATLWPLS